MRGELENDFDLKNEVDYENYENHEFSAVYE